MDLETLRVFVATYRSLSFSKVARARSLDPSTVSRLIGSLESELGVRLFQRTTRGLAPTEAGSAYFERVAPALEELESAAEAAGDATGAISGTLRITAAITFSEMSLVPLLPAFTARYPKVTVELVLTNAVLDLIGERIDVALRLGRLSDSSHVSQKLFDLDYVACASPRYLAEHGAPERPEELTRHACLIYAEQSAETRWRFKQSGRIVEVPVAGRVYANHGTLLRDCAKSGMGVVLLPYSYVARELRNGELVELFPGLEMTPGEFGGAIWIVYPTRAYVPGRVRVFVDFLRATLTGCERPVRATERNGHAGKDGQAGERLTWSQALAQGDGGRDGGDDGHE